MWSQRAQAIPFLLRSAREQELETLDLALVKEAHAEPQVGLLMTLSGVDYTVALVTVLGNIERFADRDHAAA